MQFDTIPEANSRLIAYTDMTESDQAAEALEAAMGVRTRPFVRLFVRNGFAPARAGPRRPAPVCVGPRENACSRPWTVGSRAARNGVGRARAARNGVGRDAASA